MPVTVMERDTRHQPRSLPGSTVLQIVPALNENPATRAAVDVAIALLRSGVRVLVAGEDGPLNGEIQGLGGEWHRLASETANPLTLTRNSRMIADLIASERVDLVHALGVGASRTAAGLKKRGSFWLVHSYAIADLERPRRDKSYSRALVAGDRVITPSGYVADRVATVHQVADSRLVIIPRRIDANRFDPQSISPERAAVLRRSWKINRGERVVLVPGRLEPAHGQLNLVETARVLVNGGMRGVVFVLAGDNRRHGDYARTIAEQAKAHGVAGIVRQIGICSDMAGAYTAADFVCVPRVTPPTFALVAAEAMAMGRPVIATDVGATSEIVLAPPRVLESARTGWLAEPDDPFALARALAAALAVNASVYHAIGGRAHMIANQLFTPARVAAATLGVYATLLEGHG
jgi:glycosyltransferase involved in cell wall biosynthesis